MTVTPGEPHGGPLMSVKMTLFRDTFWGPKRYGDRNALGTGPIWCRFDPRIPVKMPILGGLQGCYGGFVLINLGHFPGPLGRSWQALPQCATKRDDFNRG